MASKLENNSLCGCWNWNDITNYFYWPPTKMLHQSNYSTDIVGLCHKFMSAGGKLICGSCQCGKINNTVLHFSKRSLDTLDPAQRTRLKDTFFFCSTFLLIIVCYLYIKKKIVFSFLWLQLCAYWRGFAFLQAALNTLLIYTYLTLSRLNRSKAGLRNINEIDLWVCTYPSSVMAVCTSASRLYNSSV